MTAALQGLRGVPKTCTFPGCGVTLDSENRYGHRLLCRPHGQQMDRARHATKAETQARTGRSKAKVHSKDPERQAVHQALGRWLALPTDPDARERLNAALVDFELRARLRMVLPDVRKTECPPPTPQPMALPTQSGIPYEDPEPINPEHRTTKQEFLSMCDEYGV